MDVQTLAAIGAVLLAAAGFIRTLTLDPRASRLAERKENADLRREIDEIYDSKREVERRERETSRRLDTAEWKLELAETRIKTLEADVAKWKALANERP